MSTEARAWPDHLRILELLEATRKELVEERALRERQAEENERLLATLRERQAMLERLSRIQRSIVNRSELQDVLDSICAGACELVGEHVSGLRLIDPADPGMMIVVSSLGLTPEMYEEAKRLPIGTGAGGRAIAEKRVVVVEHYESAPDAIPGLAARGLHAAMAAPVYENGRVVGSLVVASYTENRRFSPAEQEVLQAFAEHASLALTDARNYRDALHRALHDQLTGLPNRSLFLDRLEHAMARVPRARRRLAVLFLDIDGFKAVNDTFGHAAGDEALLAIAQRISSCLRPSDTAARFGGDEFAILLEDVAGADDAVAVAERVLEALGEPLEVQGHRFDLAASIGIACGGLEDTDLLRRADVAMYRAKARGRGSYAIAEEGQLIVPAATSTSTTAPITTR
jgi:diguanylate cyclase (GGDEF)-like protein